VRQEFEEIVIEFGARVGIRLGSCNDLGFRVL